MAFGLRDNDIAQIKEILSACSGIQEALIFGSRAMGTQKNGSDVDIALKGDITFSMISDIKNKLEDTNLPYFFDVVGYELIKEPKLVEHIDRVGKVVFRGESRCDIE